MEDHLPTAAAATIPDDIISPEVLTLQSLALKGSWNSIVETTLSSLQSPSTNLRYPHDHLACLSLTTISLLKLRRFSDAEQLLTSLDPDLSSPSYRYDAFPKLYPNRSGSMLPFALRWAHAILPSFLGRRAESLDRLYVLLSFVRLNFAIGEEKNSIWRRREEFVVSTIISFHSSQKEYLVCLQLLGNMISEDSKNVSLLSKLGYVQLQFGDVEGAKSTFSRVEEVVEESGGGVEGRNLVGRNKALVYMVGKDYVSAVREYDECIERDGSDCVAVNNKALCLMYLRDLSDSIKVLENALERVPTVALNETLVVNLCSMYELAFVNHTDIKRTLSNWIARLAPDDFDSSCTRI